MPTITVHAIYASASGNTELVVDTVANVWRQAGWQVETSRSERTAPEFLSGCDLVLFATSTWEHGRLSPFFEPFLEKMKALKFAGQKAAFIGMGDVRYEPVLFNRGIEKVRDVWIQNGGEQHLHTMKINGDPEPFLVTTVIPWAKEVVEHWGEAASASVEKTLTSAGVTTGAPQGADLPQPPQEGPTLDAQLRAALVGSSGVLRT